MASTDRPPAHDLSQASLEGIDLRRAGLFAVVRQLEARAAAKPRLGRAKRPEQSIVDLAQFPSLSFEGATLSGVEQKKGRPLLRGHWLGLLGPMGPLPTHLTEFAIYERRNAKKHPFGDWLDLIAGRMLQLFYRAWAQSQPAASEIIAATVTGKMFCVREHTIILHSFHVHHRFTSDIQFIFSE